jgi:hypothetical protein
MYAHTKRVVQRVKDSRECKYLFNAAHARLKVHEAVFPQQPISFGAHFLAQVADAKTRAMSTPSLQHYVCAHRDVRS